MVKKVVIIGGGAAGVDVLELLLRGKGAANAEELEITLLKKEHEGFFSMCGLPFALQGLYQIKDLNIFEPEFYRVQGIDFRTGTEVTRINLEEGYVHLDSGEDLSYDELVIATGSKPFIPPIEGTKLEGVYTLSSKEDGEKVEAALHAEETRNAVIIGAGWIGLQAAVAFSKRGITTRVVEKFPYLLPAILDADMASLVKKRLDKEVTFMLGRTVSALRGDQHVKSVLVDGEEFPADIVLISAGVRPNVDLARATGIAVGESGGIMTDPALRVKKGNSYLNNIYALGDCIEVVDAVTHRPRLSQLASTALIQARVVANNIRGISSSYGPCLSPTAATISGLQIGSVGVISEVARRYGIPIKSGSAVKYTKARFFPGGKLIIAKLLFEASGEKLIGAQLIAEETVAERINELTLGIRAGITARDVWMRERCYDPSLTMVEDVIIDAAIKAVGS
jgi:NADH oxidase (H2O2-forming)